MRHFLPSPRRALPALLALGLAACGGARPAAAPAAEPAVRLRVVHTNDVHGRLLPERPSWANGREVGGAAALAAHFDSAAARFNGPTLLLSAGDDLQGTTISNLSWGRATIAAFNAAGYDAAAIGNHEFDWGQDTLRARIGESRFPWLAANLFVAGADTHPARVRAWAMLERRGVRVAVVGIALPSTPEVVLAGRVDGLRFAPAAPAIDRAAREARAAGADFVVVAMHVGASCEEPGNAPEEESSGCAGSMLEIARALAEPVDLIVGGHSHRRVMTTAGGIPVIEAASYTQAYSVTDLERRGDGSVVLSRAVRVPYADEVDADSAVARVVAEWDRAVRPLSERVMAGLAAPLEHDGGEEPLGNLLADAFRRATGADAALVNNGSIRRGLPAGPLTYGVLYELQPFQNALVVLDLTGEQLRAALEVGLGDRGRPNAHVSGITVIYAAAAPRGSRVREIRRDDGSVVGPGDRVTLGVSEFVAGGGDRFEPLRGVPARRTGSVDLDALIAYLQAQPQPVVGPGTGRWRAGN